MESNNVGKRIAQLRKQNGWSQTELAEKLNVTDKAVSKWENGGMPSVDIFPKLSKIFNVSIDYLMLGDVEDMFSEAKSNGEYDEENDCIIEKTNFEQSIEALTLDELDLLLSDQRDLYTDEELQVIQAKYEELLKDEPDYAEEINQAAIDSLPKNLVCPKCDGVNANPDRFCEFCGYDFLKSDYSTEPKEGLGCLGYLVAFLIPIVGLIWGVVKGDKGVAIFSIIIFLIHIGFSKWLYNVILNFFLFM